MIGSITTGEAHALWDVLHGDAYVAAILGATSDDGEMAVMRPSADSMTARMMEVTALSRDKVEAFLELVTYRHGYHPDPAIAPLVRLGDDFLIAPTLVIASNFERNLLRGVALDPAQQGPIGDARGREGGRLVEQLLATICGAETRRELEVIGAGGQVAGDLDVVAFDSGTRRGLILEVKWPAPPDHIIEVLRVETMVSTAQAKLEDLRDLIVRGEAWVRGWPAAWPSPADPAWTWMVLVKDHLPYSPTSRAHQIQPISWEYLWSVCRDTLGGTIERLASEEDLPKEGDDYERVWHPMRVGPYDVKIEGFELYDRQGDPRDLSTVLGHRAENGPTEPLLDRAAI